MDTVRGADAQIYLSFDRWSEVTKVGTQSKRRYHAPQNLEIRTGGLSGSLS